MTRRHNPIRMPSHGRTRSAAAVRAGPSLLGFDNLPEACHGFTVPEEFRVLFEDFKAKHAQFMVYVADQRIPCRPSVQSHMDSLQRMWDGTNMHTASIKRLMDMKVHHHEIAGQFVEDPVWLAYIRVGLELRPKMMLAALSSHHERA